ncbi:MAG: PEP-CTERM system histidine kinase PrsK [Methylococcaceae bacterium]|nr:PEP-CTERM system histidine kinase PrsK [Methylococcaceae bacterium]
MEHFNYYSYLSATIAYLLLLPISLIGVKKNPVALPFFVAVVFSLVWAGTIAIFSYRNTLSTSDVMPFETLRNTALLFLLSAIMAHQRYEGNYWLLFRSHTVKLLVVLTGFIFVLEANAKFRYPIQQFLGQDLRLFAHVIFAILGLMLVEQIYRNAVTGFRWAIKFLCLGIGGLFIIDFIVYSKSLLFSKLDSSLWDTRGFINALIVPLLAISIFRLQSESIKISFSRKIAFHTTVLFGTGLYLILMSLAGVYIRDYGGNWGEIAQIIFIFLAILLLLILFASGKARALAKFYFNKHFFHYRYDYRDEWIKLSKTISQLDSINELSSFIINTLVDLVESSGGGIWLKNEQDDYYLAEQNNLGFTSPQLVYSHDSLIRFLSEKKWVIDFVEFFDNPEVYEGVDLSAWYAEEKNVWLIIPLFRQNDLEAFVVLTQARISRRLNWEDHDLLKTIGMQLTNALALSHASDALSRSRQFEAYNRLSAYLVHDLKNLVAQISLIVKNAVKHKHKPEFIDDSIATLENVVIKIEYILSQLKKGNVNQSNKIVVNLPEIISDVAQQQAGNRPALQVSILGADTLKVFAEKEKITAILGHLVQNAQEATDDEGKVCLELSKCDQYAVIKVIDTGSGMDEKFIAERLFKPFDTTKGNAGMGIGVYEARDYILKFSGEITVDSQPGAGTTFTIRLPLVQQ